MKRQLAACTSLIALCWTGQALAQQTPAAHEATTVDEIVVTGEKFGRNLQETATSVGYVGGRDIAESPMINGRDVFERLVNVNIAAADGRFAIRGVSFDNTTGAGFGALGVIYIDNVRQSDKATRFGGDLLWDVQSVEVLRGAQSTLQGRNALAGAIYIKSQDPTFDWQAKGRVIASQGNGRDYAVAVGGPLIDDRLAFRLTAEKRQFDGFVSNPVLNTDKAGYADDLMIRGKLLFQPTDDITVRLAVSHADVERRDAPSDTRVLGADGYLAGAAGRVGFETGVPGQASANRRVTYVDIPEYDRNKITAGALTAEWRLSDALTLTAETTASYSDNYKQRDGDGGAFLYSFPSKTLTVQNPYGIGDFDRIRDGVVPMSPVDMQHEQFRIFSQEVRAKYDAGGRLRALGGAYYTKEHESEDNFSLLVFRGIQGLVKSSVPSAYSAYAPLLASFYSADAPLYTFNAQPVDVENYAVYGEGEFDLTTRLTLNLGLRYDHETNTSAVINSGEVLGLPDPNVLGAINPGLGQLAAGVNVALDPFVEATSQADQSFQAWLPKAGLRYQFNDNTAVGLVVQRAYRAGGVSVNVVRQLVTPLRPEYTWNYELYLRSELFDSRARLNANVYYVDWTDQQVTIDLSQRNTDSIGANAGKSQLYGGEIQFDGDLTDTVSLYGGLGYSHTEFTDFNVTLPDAAATLGVKIDPDSLAWLAGKAFPNAPQWSAVLGGRWRGADGAFANFNINYTSHSYADAANTRRNDARTLVNVRAGRDFGRFSASVFARNLFDVDYVRDANNARPLLGDPRVIGVAFDVRY